MSKKPVFTLNALRGFGAIYVVFNHIIYFGNYLDPGYLPHFFKYFLNEEIFRVLIYFVISGTVIQLSNKQAISTSNLFQYLKKRTIRIYPMYALSLIIALLISKSIYSVYTIVGNFTFLEIMVTDVIKENNPIWSLHYEVIYYLLFIPISYFDVNPVKVAIAALLTGLVNYFLYPYTNSSLLTSYSFGFVFWASGLIIARYLSNKADEPIVYRHLISFLFLMICLPFINNIKMLINQFCESILGYDMVFPYKDDKTWFEMAINFYDFSFLPYCIMAVILFSNYKFKYHKAVLWIIQLLPAYTLYSVFKVKGHLDLWTNIVPISSYILSLFFLLNVTFVNLISRKIFQVLMWFGNISYGIYIIHMPLLVLYSQNLFFTGSVYSFSVRLVSYLLITVLSAYWLENTYQRFIVKLISK